MLKLRHYMILLPLLLLLTGCGFDDATIHSNAIANHTDLSVSYLAMLFGNVGHVLHGVSGQMLGMLLYKFNQGVLCVAGLWLSYTVFQFTMNAAEGLIGQKKPHLIIFKLTVGISLILPFPSQGYDIIQEIMMKVVVEGVSLANMTWDYGLDYLDTGGSLWQPPGSIDGNQTSTNYSSTFTGIMAKTGPLSSAAGNVITNKKWNAIVSPPGSTDNFGLKVFLGDVCSFESSLQHVDDPTSTYASPDSSTPSIERSPFFDTSAPYFDFPSKSPAIATNDYTCGRIDLSQLNNQSACDTDNWQKEINSDAFKNPDSSSTALTGAANAWSRCIYLKSAIYQMAEDFKTAAQVYVCKSGHYANSPDCDGYKNIDEGTHISEAALAGFLDYINSIMPTTKLSNSERFIHDGNQHKFILNAKKGGWVTAGRYYWDLSRIEHDNAHFAGSDMIKFVPKPMTLGTAPLSPTLKYPALDDLTVKDLGGYFTKASASLAAYMDTSQKGDTTVGGQNNIVDGARNLLGGVMSILFPVFGGLIQDIVGLFASYTTAPVIGIGMDPIIWLSGIGMLLMHIAANFYLAAVSATTLAASLTTVCDAQLDLSKPLNLLIGWASPLVWLICGSLFMSGLAFGYYLPLYPFILFTFGVISWLIAVIEAMVAAPLVAFGLTHPDNHDFLGSAQQALMIGLSIFLRPTLMVIGMIAAMLVSFVSLRIIIFSFCGFLTDLYSYVPQNQTAGGQPLAAAGMAAVNTFSSNLSSGLFSNAITSILTLPMMLVIFTNIVYQVVTQCYNLIFLLPDYVLRWIGAPQPLQIMNPQQMSDQIKGSAQSAGEQGRKAGEQISQAKGQHKKNTAEDSTPASSDGGKVSVGGGGSG